MTHLRLSVLVALVSAALGPTSWAQAGDREEIAALGCAACHDDLAPAGLRTAPNLRATVPLMDPSFLEAFIAAPHAAQPGTRMPDMLGGIGPEERARAATELAAFLRRETGAPSEAGAMAEGSQSASMERGERIFHEVGCVMCHGPRVGGSGGTRVPEGPDDARALDHVAAKYTTEGLAAFLLEPLRHRPSGLMPDMQLSRSEAADVAAYLAPAGAQSSAPSSAEDALADAGRERFGALRCGSCHAGFDTKSMPLDAPVRTVDLAGGLHGCLANEPAAGVPRYAWEDGQRERLGAAIAQLDQPRSAAEHVAATLAALRCTSCHERNGEGGVPQRLDAYLVTDEPDLGDHARRPPRLTEVGAKLRLPWMERVLLDGASVRPYMHTRMPIFGKDNVGMLPALFEEVDAAPPLELPEETGDAQREARDAAQRMVGLTGFGCITCHTFNAKPATSFQGLDLLTSPERLRERWFHELLVSPQAKLPGIVMPEAWPGGVAALDDVLGGDTDRQIAAIWHYLKLGTSARDPIGISQPRWEVNVADEPVVYRGRSRVAGFRGIAVGFPEGIHYAFDARNGSLAALWRGDFVSVNWNGQGAGDFFPRTKAAPIARDVAWLEGIEPDAPWPLRPITTKEEPINADPTYPRQHGFRFRGYRLDGDGVPTLRYALNDVAIEDRLTPTDEGESAALRRRIILDAPAANRVSFRVLAGEIATRADGRFECGGVIVALPGMEPRLRPFADGQELLLDLELSAGRTTLEISYDLAH